MKENADTDKPTEYRGGWWIMFTSAVLAVVGLAIGDYPTPVVVLFASAYIVLCMIAVTCYAILIKL